MRNWKTSVGGIIAAAAIGLHSSTDVRLKALSSLLEMIAVTWLGYHASDKGE